LTTQVLISTLADISVMTLCSRLAESLGKLRITWCQAAILARGATEIKLKKLCAFLQAGTCDVMRNLSKNTSNNFSIGGFWPSPPMGRFFQLPVHIVLRLAERSAGASRLNRKRYSV